MNYDRKRLQETCEHELGYSFEEIVKNRKLLKTVNITKKCAEALSNAALDDLKDFYFKGLTSLFGALADVSEKRYSWASVKLYYSVYYLLQVEMLTRGSGLIRTAGLHRITFKEGETFIDKKDRRYNSDHSGTILHFIDMFSSVDPLLTNDVGGKKSYEWLLEQRERVNYRERYFSEPSYPNFWAGPISFGATPVGVEAAVQTYLDDSSMSFIFQEDHAILGVPVKRLMITSDILKMYGHKNILSVDKKEFLRKLLPCGNLENYIDL